MIIAKNKEHLQILIEKEVEMHGYNCNLNHIDVSNVTNMECLFYSSQFNGDISQWKPLSLTKNKSMFDNCPASSPYWFFANKKDINKAITSYGFAKSLNNKLIEKTEKNRKIKI